MKKMIMIVAAVIAFMATATATAPVATPAPAATTTTAAPTPAAVPSFFEVYNSLYIVSSNVAATATVKEAKATATATARKSKKFAEAYQKSGLGAYTIENANYTVKSRYALNKELYTTSKGWGEDRTQKVLNDFTLKGIESEKDQNLRAAMFFEYKKEKHDKR